MGRYLQEDGRIGKIDRETEIGRKIIKRSFAWIKIKRYWIIEQKKARINRRIV